MAVFQRVIRLSLQPEHAIMDDFQSVNDELCLLLVPELCLTGLFSSKLVLRCSLQRSQADCVQRTCPLSQEIRASCFPATELADKFCFVIINWLWRIQKGSAWYAYSYVNMSMRLRYSVGFTQSVNLRTSGSWNFRYCTAIIAEASSMLLWCTLVLSFKHRMLVFLNNMLLRHVTVFLWRSQFSLISWSFES